MPKSSSLVSLSLLASMLVLSACVQTPSTEGTSPTPTTSANTTSSEADKAKQAMADAKPKLTTVGVKSIKPDPALKPGHKLSPQEVEDLIRKLSVCRPS